MSSISTKIILVNKISLFGSRFFKLFNVIIEIVKNINNQYDISRLAFYFDIKILQWFIIINFYYIENVFIYLHYKTYSFMNLLCLKMNLLCLEINEIN